MASHGTNPDMMSRSESHRVTALVPLSRPRAAVMRVGVDWLGSTASPHLDRSRGERSLIWPAMLQCLVCGLYISFSDDSKISYLFQLYSNIGVCLGHQATMA